MLTEQVIRDIWEVHSRLLDHRPALQGHIKSFVRDFEEKRGNQEQEKLNKLKTMTGDMKDTYVEETRLALDSFLANVQAKLQVAVEVCKKIEEKENKVDIGILELKRQTRRENWDSFMQQQFEKSAKVDQEMDAEMKKVADEYGELEKKIEFISSATP